MNKYTATLLILWCVNLCAEATDIASKQRGIVRTASSPNLLSGKISDTNIVLNGYGHIYLNEYGLHDMPAWQIDKITEADMLKDSNIISTSLYTLANMFGIEVNNGTKIVNISYPYLLKCAIKHTTGDLQRWIEKVDGVFTSKANTNNTAAIDELYRIATEVVFDVSSKYEQKFKNVFSRMVSNFTGEQRIKSLIILQKLINEGIMGASYYRGKKMDVVEGCESLYDSDDHCVTLGPNDFDERTILGDNVASKSSEFVLQEDTLTHELSHAYHFMLGIHAAKVRNAWHVAAFGNDDFRRLLYPFLEKDAFDKLVQGIHEKFGENFLLPKNMDEDTQEYISQTEDFLEHRNFDSISSFLKANNFFGNSRLDTNTFNDLSDPSLISATKAAIYIVNLMPIVYSNGEEVLTIRGILPIMLQDPSNPNSTHRYLIVDNQNENVFLVRAADIRRLFHASRNFLRYILPQDKETISKVLMVMSEIMSTNKGFIHRQKEEMAKFVYADSKELDITYDAKTITKDEIIATISALFSHGHSKPINSLIKDLIDCALRNRIELDTEFEKVCLKSPMPSLQIEVIDYLWSKTFVNASFNERLERILEVASSETSPLDRQTIVKTFFAYFACAKLEDEVKKTLDYAKKYHLFSEFVNCFTAPAMPEEKEIFNELPEEVEGGHISDAGIILRYAIKQNLAIRNPEILSKLLTKYADEVATSRASLYGKFKEYFSAHKMYLNEEKFDELLNSLDTSYSPTLDRSLNRFFCEQTGLFSSNGHFIYARDEHRLLGLLDSYQNAIISPEALRKYVDAHKIELDLTKYLVNNENNSAPLQE
ncbi:MAG: hypothetical protein LBB21_02800 [Holosporaceae bacterium]|jgi:hypothetical protein|nr:hypothetical protein [Holosporaceae bacterium]